jgi:sigma-B regulation protein RsbU (phosphoserine phosphatase)
LSEDTNAQQREDSSIPPRAPRVALLLEGLGNSYADPIFSEIMETARAHGVEVRCLVSGLEEDDFVSKRRHVSQLATSREVDGILVLTLGAWQLAERVSTYCERFRPLPMCSIAVPWKKHPHVLIDNEPGMRAGITHLIEIHGYKRIAFVRGPEESEEAELRYRVYREVLASHRIPFDPELVAPGWFVVQSGVDAIRLFLDERKVSFDVVACANDGMAMGVMRELAARGIAVPGRVGVLGFDDAEDSHYAEPPLTTVRQPTRQQAKEAFEVLLRRIHGEQTTQPSLLKTELVVRESCGCAPFWPSDSAPQSAEGAPPLGIEAIIADVIHVRAPTTSSGPSIETLCRAFASDVRTGATSFLRELDAALEAAAEIREDVGGFQKILTVLDRSLADRLPKPSYAWQRANALLHAARILVSVVAERIPAGFKQRYEDFSLKIQRANQGVMTAGDLDSLATAAARHLPEFGISSFYVCLYEGEAIPASSMRLVLAWDKEQRLELPSGGVRFEAGPLLPPQFAPGDRWTSSVVHPLERSGPSPGYMVFEYGPKEGFVYELLSQQMSAACSRIRLLEQLVEEAARRVAADRERLEKEVRVAQHIQVGLLPRRFEVPGLAISAALLRAAPVGGDYYDVIPMDDGCFIGMGNVTGDGLAMGLTLLMLQSVVSGLARSSPDDPPSAILPYVEAVLSENIRQRMARDERARLTLARYRSDGRISVAGGKAGFLLCRASGRTEGHLPSSATRKSRAPQSLAGPDPGAARENLDTTFELAPGDMFALYTSGIDEQENDAILGQRILPRALERLRREPVDTIANAVAAEIRPLALARRSDIAILIAKHQGPSRGAREPS